MAVISNSKTATELRLEIIAEFDREIERNEASLDRNMRNKGSAKDRTSYQAVIQNLKLQRNFWVELWIEGAQHSDA